MPRTYWLLGLSLGLLIMALVVRVRWAARADRLPPARTGFLVPVNSADAPTLELLPGVGPATAQRIIDERRAHGPFNSVADLRRVRGLGAVTLQRIAPLIAVGTSRTQPARPYNRMPPHGPD